MNKFKLVILILCAVGFLFLLNSPVDFPVETIINIEKGESLRSVALKLKENNVIRSQIAFEAFVIIYGGEKHLMSADYFFEKKLPVYEVARRISKGERYKAPVKVTIPEGFDASMIAEVFSSKLYAFDKEKFILETKALEGYLFPDTYFFFSTDTEEEVIKLMRENFENKLEPLRPQIVSSGRSEREIIVMASLVEGEAKGDDDRDTISGILWKRLDMKMPLQVDVAPETYDKVGLPKNPIGNPGLEAIKAAITPEKSPYLYYLHNKDGNIHYAKNFEEHKMNRQKYLR
ncbi:hypothetical protein A3A95_00940 [Candidatus Nomurabacteria bacterium RIFCSPLOWO2_01_FULL_39_18]|uniref:Endolytic murein transglycosylase n=1 Tax=Candidatus Nomurabacteria bacterium RIFCSPHIGHO2_01_FULL_40_24b TaxID=1801739 RepID=A0A1F6V6N9_9BACT|nr:MAG: hypothetical protein A2647_02740 [Candidatus Nomurabacteria bacterium RIFCSPHIGHO2_01_FULL_40_24b]OGI89873.1 MAG: hypothetical protein A3A95_00940 [Candidatus Nomurabacteria bacterium RIFCSPLOWO2_01_FULL_39_18]